MAPCSSGASLGATRSSRSGAQTRNSSARSFSARLLLLPRTLWWLHRLRIRSGHWGERINCWLPSSSFRASTSNSSTASRATTARLITARSGSIESRPLVCSRSITGSSLSRRQKGSSRGRSIQRRSTASRHRNPGRRRFSRITRSRMSTAKTLWNSSRSIRQAWSVRRPLSSLERA